eukprot:PhF_6_TR14914/c0_g1_i2/m.23303
MLEHELDHFSSQIATTQHVSTQAIHSLISSFEDIKTSLTNGSLSVPQALEQMMKDVEASESQVSAAHRSDNVAFASLARGVDSAFKNPVVCDPDENVLSDDQNTSLLRLIALQLLHDGHSDISDALADEYNKTTIPNMAFGTPHQQQHISQHLPLIDSATRQQYEELHKVLLSIPTDVSPALTWCGEALQRLNPFTTPTTTATTIKAAGSLEALHLSKLTEKIKTLQFKLHSTRCVQLMNNGDAAGALKYLRTYITPLAVTKPLYREVQRLVTSITFATTTKPNSGMSLQPLGPPHVYPWLDHHSQFPTHDEGMVLTDVQRTFQKIWCEVHLLPTTSPLQVCVDAGYAVMPLLEKYASLPIRTPDMVLQLTASQQGLPSYQSVALCPVTQSALTDASGLNPAVLLPCGHVISHQAVRSLGRHGSHRVKCPYCPMECDV